MNEIDTRADDEISLLDLILVIARNWVLLLVVPTAIGAITFLAINAQPSQLKSEASIGLPVPVVEALIADMEDEDTLDSRLALAASGEDGLSVIHGADAESSILVLRHRDPGARAALEGLLEALANRAGELPLPDSHGELVARIAALEAGQALRDGVITQLEEALADISASERFDAEGYAAAALALDHMMSRRAEDAAELARLELELVTSVTDEIAVGPVSGPLREGRSPVMMAVLALLGSGFLLLVLVFVRSGLQGASRDPETREKLEAIKNAFLLRKPADR